MLCYERLGSTRPCVLTIHLHIGNTWPSAAIRSLIRRLLRFGCYSLPSLRCGPNAKGPGAQGPRETDLERRKPRLLLRRPGQPKLRTADRQ